MAHPPAASLRVPVELRRDGEPARFYRLAHQISERGLQFASALPRLLSGPLLVRFHLPGDLPGDLAGDRAPILCHGRAAMIEGGDGATASD